MICLGEEPNTYMSDLRESFEELRYVYISKIKWKPQVSELIDARVFESMLFHYSITQDNVVDTPKFTGSSEAWNNLYADIISRRWPILVLNFTRERAKG
jgi:hypothetical protein